MGPYGRARLAQGNETRGKPMLQQMNTMDDLMENMLIGLYTAEQQSLQALPQLAKEVQTPELKMLFQEHQKHTQEQCRRLERIFQELEMDTPTIKHNPAVAALMQEAQDLIKAGGNKKIIEAALVMAAQKMEHLEIAGYGTAVELAKMLGEADLAELLAQNLDEEERTDQMLTEVARKAINRQAMQQGENDDDLVA